MEPDDIDDTSTTDESPRRRFAWIRRLLRVPYRSHLDRLTPEAQGDVANYSMRSGL